MSHFTKLDKANIKSKDAFVAACGELGLTDVAEKSEIRGYRGRTMTVDLAVRLEGAYDIGLKKNGEVFDMVSDWMMLRPSEELKKKSGALNGRDLANRLLQLTTKHDIVAQYRKLGYQARVTEDEKRHLHVSLTK